MLQSVLHRFGRIEKLQSNVVVVIPSLQKPKHAETAASMARTSESKNQCDPQVIYPPPTATNCPPAGGVFTWQVNEGVALLGLAESYTDVVSALCAGTDRF